ncbi:unnamed protein product [Rotaria socialis]|uniref:Uncharacterized protein n=1 Tax=Rotaria socialis TaxID=392032 RepID=A0A820UPW1_9BILA|nr:unnamed protein product [Rotaria socialis]
MSILTTSSAGGSSSSTTNKSTPPSITSRLGPSTTSNNTVVLSHHGRRILQNFHLVWLDANIDESNEDYKHSLGQLSSIMVPIRLFADAEECTRFLSINDIFMYTSLLREVLFEIDDDDDEDNKSIKEFVDYCRLGNNIDHSEIEHFKRQYRRDTSISWYTTPSFIASMLN